MVTIPRYQQRTSVPVGGQEYRQAFGPGWGPAMRQVGNGLQVVGQIVGMAQGAGGGGGGSGAGLGGMVQGMASGAMKGMGSGIGASSAPLDVRVTEHDLAEAEVRALDWRQSQLANVGQADPVQPPAFSRQAASEGLSSGARAAFDALTEPQVEGYSALADSQRDASRQRAALSISQARQALGVEEFVRLADVAPRQARAALGSAAAAAGALARASGADEAGVAQARRATLVAAQVRRIGETIGRDPARAAKILEEEGGVLPDAQRARLSREVELEQARVDANQAAAQMAGEHPDLVDDLDGFLAGMEAAAGEGAHRVEAFRAAGMGAWRAARAAREAMEQEAWEAVAQLLTPSSDTQSWTQLPGELWQKLSDRQQKALRARLVAPWAESNPGILAGLRTLAVVDPEAFREADLMAQAEHLTPSDLGEWTAIQQAARFNTAAWRKRREALSIEAVAAAPDDRATRSVSAGADRNRGDGWATYLGFDGEKYFYALPAQYRDAQGRVVGQKAQGTILSTKRRTGFRFEWTRNPATGAVHYRFTDTGKGQTSPPLRASAGETEIWGDVIIDFSDPSDTVASGGRVSRDVYGLPAIWRSRQEAGAALPDMTPASAWKQYAPDINGMNLASEDGPYFRITFHHSGGAETPQAVEAMHRGKEGPLVGAARQAADLVGAGQVYGYADVGYHFLIGADGKIYEGRPLEFRGAHVGRENEGNIGIAFLGDYSRDPLTAAQVRSAELLVDILNETYGVRASAKGKPYIFTHGQFDSKKSGELAGARRQIDEIRKRP